MTIGQAAVPRWPARRRPPLPATRRGHAAIGDLGIHSGQARSTALFQLATDLPAAVLARLLGVHIAVAAAWQRASAGDWAAYDAEISRRARKDENQ